MRKYLRFSHSVLLKATQVIYFKMNIFNRICYTILFFFATAEAADWIQGSHGSIPSNAVLAGYDNGSPVYVGK